MIYVNASDEADQPLPGFERLCDDHENGRLYSDGEICVWADTQGLPGGRFYAWLGQPDDHDRVPHTGDCETFAAAVAAAEAMMD